MKKSIRIISLFLCAAVLFTMCFALTSCKKKEEKIKYTSEYITDRRVDETFKDSDGNTAYKLTMVLPQLDEKKIATVDNFNAVISAIEQDSRSTAQAVIGNKLYKKGVPWTETADYELTYASNQYISAVIERRRETSDGRISYMKKPVVFSFRTNSQASLEDFAKINGDNLHTKLANMIIDKINDDGGNPPKIADLRAGFTLEDFALTASGIDIYLQNDSLLSYKGVKDCYSFSFAELTQYLKLPNLPSTE